MVGIAHYRKSPFLERGDQPRETVHHAADTSSLLTDFTQSQSCFNSHKRTCNYNRTLCISLQWLAALCTCECLWSAFLLLARFRRGFFRHFLGRTSYDVIKTWQQLFHMLVHHSKKIKNNNKSRLPLTNGMSHFCQVAGVHSPAECNPARGRIASVKCVLAFWGGVHRIIHGFYMIFFFLFFWTTAAWCLSCFSSLDFGERNFRARAQLSHGLSNVALGSDAVGSFQLATHNWANLRLDQAST